MLAVPSLILVILSLVLTAAERLTVFLHIGAHKTGSTHLQSFLVSHWNELEVDKVCLPFHNHHPKDFSGIIGAVKDNNSHSEHFLRTKKCLEKGMHTVISAEGLCSLPFHDIQKLRALILSAAGSISIDIKIILYYREWLNFVYSTYTQLAKVSKAGAVSFPEFLFMRGDTLAKANSINFHTIVENYISVFGEENMILVDYYGVESTGNDVAYVFVCEILHAMCREAALLINAKIQEMKHENQRPNEVYLHYIHIFSLYLNAHSVRLCRKDYQANAAYIADLTKRKIKFPTTIAKMTFFRDYFIEQDAKFQKKYGHLMLYSSHKLNVNQILLFQFEEVDIIRFFESATWQLFMKQEMLSLTQKGEICSLTP
jgi:hypothetical protein